MSRVVLVAWLAAFLLSGCGGDGNPPVASGIVVQGKVVKGGQPLAVPRQDVGFGMVQVMLIPVSGSGETERCSAKPDGTFQVLGAGKGLPAGRYKLAVYQRDKGIESDLLEGAFSEQKTPIVVELPEKNVGGRLDLGVIELDSYSKK